MSVDSTSARFGLLWTYARPHVRVLSLGLVLALLGSAMGLATPLVTKWVLDSLGGSGSIAEPVAALGFLLIMGSVIWYAQWNLLGSLGERVVLAARESLLRRLFGATVPEVTKKPPGELVARVTSDTVLLREAASSSVVGLINGTVMLAGTLILMGFLDMVLLGATIGSVIVVGILFALLMPAIAKAKESAQDHLGLLGGMLEGSLRAIRTVKVSLAERRQADRIINDAKESARYSIQAVRKEALAWTISWTGIQFAIILILGIGAFRVSEGLLEVSSLIAFLLYAFGLMGPITEISQNVTAMQSGIAAAGRIRELDSLEQEIQPLSTVEAVVPNPSAPVLELRGVTAAYGPGMAPAVHDIDLTIPRRGHVAIVGPTGAGKTTLFSLMLRFLEPAQGEMRLEGQPYREQTHAGIRQRLAYVEQETPVVPGTIRENLLYSYPGASDAEVRRVLEEVQLTGLADRLDSPLSATSVSGGERQRIALARAILRTPDVLLLDEATAQVDALTEAAIHDCVRRRAAQGAVVTIAHRLSTVIDADTIIVMQDGRIRARGTHEELLIADSLYREFIETLRIASDAYNAA
ncbi:ABC transporter ATP-binding protein [Catelliglobosispora koreensis]|uniref:ABC transporter ATP-binding protein n=1 Tax=Catelliglobosispora koreensis TaxID=129052 RepID=UPI000378DB3D|nr:ABC transporter ATP-binding protein [Catelliglobosispora koreensis]